MPVPTPKQYKEILANCRAKRFALPAINVSNMVTANAAIAALTESRSDGIIQLSLGAGKFASGTAVADSVLGSISVAQHIHLMTKKLNIFVALHTDHCQKEELNFVKKLLEYSREYSEKNGQPLFNGHMFDGSALPLAENMEIAKPLLKECGELGIILEVEAGVVGGEEEGAAQTDDTSKLYTTPQDMLFVAKELFPIGYDFMFAATFGNVHGIYKPGNVKLNPEILKNGQAAVRKEFKGRDFNLVFHGGSGTPVEQIHETLEYGVVKMNVDTATQFAFTQPILKAMLKNADKIQDASGSGSKKLYDPRSYLKEAELGMKTEVLSVLKNLRCYGETLF